MKRKERNIKVGWQRKGKDERGNENERKIKEESRKRQEGKTILMMVCYVSVLVTDTLPLWLHFFPHHKAQFSRRVTEA